MPILMIDHYYLQDTTAIPDTAQLNLIAKSN
jgi:hypothetical protein